MPLTQDLLPRLDSWQEALDGVDWSAPALAVVVAVVVAIDKWFWDRRDRRREQASQVAAWFGERENGELTELASSPALSGGAGESLRSRLSGAWRQREPADPVVSPRASEWGAWVRNNSDVPVYEVEVSILRSRPRQGRPERTDLPPKTSRRLAVVPPGPAKSYPPDDEDFVAKMRGLTGIDDDNYRVALMFRDSHNRWCERTVAGVLSVRRAPFSWKHPLMRLDYESRQFASRFF